MIGSSSIQINMHIFLNFKHLSDFAEVYHIYV